MNALGGGGHMGYDVSIVEHGQVEEAEALAALMRRAYTVEAGLLGAEDFAPLRRTAQDVASATESVFYGVRGTDGAWVAACEVEPEGAGVCIASLVVCPSMFRRGVASALLAAVLSRYVGQEVVVSTGVDNAPALSLYAKWGFEARERWQTPCGLDMVTLGRVCKISHRHAVR